MKIWLSPQLSIALLSVPLAPSHGYGFGLLQFGSRAREHPCAKGRYQHPVSTGDRNKGPSCNPPSSLDGLGGAWGASNIAASFSGEPPAGTGVPPRAFLQTRAPAQKEVAAHQYAEVVAARQ